MIIELILALIIGILAGTFTGLAPGIHINLIAALILAASAIVSFFSPIILVVFIVSMAITHTFLDFIPSVFLGAPEEDTFLSILPGHEMLKEGRGYEAVILTLYGSLAALPVILVFTPVFIYFLPFIFTTFKVLIPFVLIAISLYSVLRESSPLPAFIVFSASGILGFLSFNLPVKEPLMPLLTGLFGISALMLSLHQKQKIKPQRITPLRKIKLAKKEFFNASVISLIAPLCSFLPGIGSGHAAFISSEILPQKKRGFLFLVGATNTIIMALSFVTIYTIGKARSGAAAAVQQLLSSIALSDLIVILVAVIISAIISFFLGIYLAKRAAHLINLVNYQKLSLIVIFMLLLLNILFSNFLGLIVLFTSSALGIFCVLSRSRRINLMGALIIPAVLFYLTI